MNPRRTTQPAIEPVTLAEAKLHLRVDGSDENALITSLITAARESCEYRIERTLISSGWTLTLNEFQDVIRLAMPRVISVSSISYRDTNGNNQVMSAADYELANDPGYVVPASGVSWPSTYGGINDVTVVYTAGFGASASDVPAPIRQWILLAIGDMYANRERSSDKPTVPHNFSDSMLDPYRMWCA